MSSDGVIEAVEWSRRDFELVAEWYEVDPDDLIEKVHDTGAFDAASDEYIVECWDAMGRAAKELGGQAETPFDFLEASAAHDRKARAREGGIEEARSDPREQTVHEHDRGEPAAPSSVPNGDIAGYLSAALSAYRSMSGWQGLDADAAIECFIGDLSRGRIPVDPPRARSLEVETPEGRLVATRRLYCEGAYDSISIDLEKPDGSSGEVACVEVVTGSFAEGYPSKVHTFAWDGTDEEPVRVDCDISGEQMQERGWAHGVQRQEKPPFEAMTKAAVKAAERSVGAHGRQNAAQQQKNARP